MLKFICPKCHEETKIEVVMTDCLVTETVEFKDNGEAVYGPSTIHESSNSYYQCSKCGYELPVKDFDYVIDDTLEEWLRKQPYNQKQS